MKVYINRKVVLGPYGGGNNFVRAFHEFAPQVPNVEVMLDQTMNINPEVILLAGLANEGATCISAEQAIMYQMYVKPDCKIVLRVNENDARKGTTGVDDMLLKVSQHIDGTIFVSDWLKDYFNAKGWACKNQAVVVNGVQRSVFKPQPKLNNGKLNIVAHHWSDNRMKGADIYEELDKLVGEQPDKYAFTYIGRHRCDFKHTRVVKPLSGAPLGEELGKHDVYVSASRFDPGPNHILEALACELPTLVHADGGGCVEFAGKASTYSDWDQLRTMLVHRDFPEQRSIALTDWRTCIDRCLGFLQTVAAQP